MPGYLGGSCILLQYRCCYSLKVFSLRETMMSQDAASSTLYRHGSDSITPTHATLREREFDLTLVKSAALVSPVLRRWYGIAAMVIGLGITIIGLIIWRSLLTPVVAGPILFVVGAVLYLQVRERYMVALSHYTGEVVTLAYEDPGEAEQVVAALRQAVGK